MDNSVALRHTFEGGWATDLGTVVEVAIEADRRIRLPFFLRCENVYFAKNGGIKSMGGLTKYNATTIESGQEIRHMFEYVRQGSAGSPTRKKVVAAGTKILADNNDGTFAAIITGRADDTSVCMTVFEDVLIISSDGNEAPQKWDQTTAAALGGSPPNFAFSVAHVNRLWAAGNPAAPYRLYYSSLLEAEQWNGAGTSGSIDIGPDDGDVITGLRVVNGQLIVWKGPNFGSIHRITGTTPSDFARAQIGNHGIGAVCHNLIFDLGTDVGFVWSDGSIRSFAGTDRYGDYEVGALSRDIESFLRTRTNIDLLKRGTAATDPSQGYTLLTIPIDGSTVPNCTILMDTRFAMPRFALWTDVQAWSVARMGDPARDDRHIIYAGGNDGFLRKTQQATLSIDDTTALNPLFLTPSLTYATPNMKKTLVAVGLGLVPTGEFEVNVGLRTESSAKTTRILASGGAVLGPAAQNQFVLGTSTLSGDQYRTIWTEDVDSSQFREILYEISISQLGQAFNIHQLHAVIEGSMEVSYEN